MAGFNRSGGLGTTFLQPRNGLRPAPFASQASLFTLHFSLFSLITLLFSLCTLHFSLFTSVRVLRVSAISFLRAYAREDGWTFLSQSILSLIIRIVRRLSQHYFYIEYTIECFFQNLVEVIRLYKHVVRTDNFRSLKETHNVSYEV